ncbi:hypothetical protein ACFXDJ_34945 [Streptomyces sp. NPDC059443]|uniref:hypothetical protein n=1 Tax=unclassified Streptomyces TaxID=2593676 RepID=UPI0036C9BB15
MLRISLAKAAAVASLAFAFAVVAPAVAAHTTGTSDTRVTATTAWETAPVGKNTTAWE